MISQDIRNTVRTLTEKAREQRLTPTDFVKACDTLLDCADQVAQLERAPVPLPLRGIYRGSSDVIDFTAFKLRRGAALQQGGAA